MQIRDPTHGELDVVFPGDSELARRMRAFDWSSTDLGPPGNWPPHLRTAVGICLTSAFPIVLWWGPDLTLLYNDAYIPFLGTAKHPRCLGRPGRECWSDIWDTIGPMHESVRKTATATWSENLPMFFARDLPREEVFVTFTFGPILSPDGRSVDGVFCPCKETTRRVVGERRLETLRRLAARAAERRSVAAACEEAMRALAGSGHDVPFAALYVVEDGGAVLRATAGLPADHALPAFVAELDDDGAAWPLATVLRSHSAREVDDPGPRAGPLPGGPWPEQTRRFVVLPIHGTSREHLAGILLLGVSPRRVWDAAYRTFFDLIAGHVANALADARAYELERESEERLRLSSQTGNVGLWDWDIAANRVTWSDSMYTIHGTRAGAFPPTLEGSLEFVHPDDRERVSRAVQRSLQEGGPYELEVRIVAGGRESWVFTKARVIREEGRPTRMLGATLDITARKRAELALRASEERFRVALESSTAGFTIMRVVRDDAGRIVDFAWEYANRAALQLVRRSASEIIGRKVNEVLPENWAHHAEVFRVFCRVAETGLPAEIESFDKSADRWFRNIATPLGDGIAIWFADETARKRHAFALQKADQRKDEFLATLAHELRNPLAPIRNAVEVLRIQAAADPTLVWARDLIDRQSQQMSRLIDDLLEVSRITSGRLQLRIQPIELAKVVELALETTGPLFERAEHTLRVSLPEQPLFVRGDAARLAQVFANLLNNAARYTERAGRVELEVARDAGQARISVRDNGMGISPEMLSEIFELFIQADRSLERSQGGLGIGLTLAKRLVEMHGGRIEAQSEGMGRGSCFTVYLPLLESTSAQDPDRHPRVDPAPAPGLRILLADDNADAAESLALLLRIHGHEVRSVHDGAEALRVALEMQPDVALLDIGMPGLNGYDVARGIRQAVARPVLLIALTGWGQEEDRRRSAEAGFQHHLVKPVDPARIFHILARVGRSESS